MIVTENKQHDDHTLAVGDFNVDFDHWLVCSRILLWNTIFVLIDLSYCESVKFTYERDMVLLT